MTFRYRSDTFALPAADIPPGFADTASLMHFVQQHVDRGFAAMRELNSHNQNSPCLITAQEALERSLVLHGSSSSGWFERVLENLLQAQGARHLDFLTEQDEGAPFTWPDENWRFRCTVLDAGAIERCIGEIGALMAWCSEHTDLVGELLDWYAADEVQAAINCNDVTVDAADYTSEGVGPAYLFVYLRSLLRLLEGASTAGLLVFHFQKHPEEAPESLTPLQAAGNCC